MQVTRRVGRGPQSRAGIRVVVKISRAVSGLIRSLPLTPHPIMTMIKYSAPPPPPVTSAPNASPAVPRAAAPRRALARRAGAGVRRAARAPLTSGQSFDHWSISEGIHHGRSRCEPSGPPRRRERWVRGGRCLPARSHPAPGPLAACRNPSPTRPAGPSFDQWLIVLTSG